MAVLKIKKIRIILHQSSAEEITEIVQKMGVVELSEISAEKVLQKREKTDFELNYISSRLDHAVSFLSTYEKSSFLKGVLEDEKTITTEKEMTGIAEEFNYEKSLNKTHGVIEKINKTKARIEDLQEEKRVLEPWTNLDIKLSSPLETETTKTLFLKGSVEDFQESVKNTCHNISEASEDHFMFTFAKKDEQEVKKAISKFKLTEVELPKKEDTPANEHSKISKEEESLAARLKELHETAKSLLLYLPKLRVISDYIRWKKERYNIIHTSYGTKESIVFEGWCLQKAIPLLREEISTKTDLFFLEEIETEEDPPVEIENKSALRPFEVVTRLYGLPREKDLDPTPFLAGFFFVFFGICLSDVGYGFLLLLFTLSALFFYNVNKDMASFMKLLAAGGASSMIAGIIFGGYFGIDPSFLPAFLQRLQYFDPIESPLPVFYMALSLGVIQIITGLILSIIRDYKNGELFSGAVENIPWLMLFASIFVWGFVHQIGEIFVYASLITIVVAGAVKSKGGVFSRAFSGVLNLYNFVGYLSDVLSYSRLLALGLATSALAFSVNLIAGMAYGVPYVGWLLFALILLVGHFFNLAVNILAAFIHTARLQFVEFFGKFVGGNSRQFKPFFRKELNSSLKKE